MDKDYFDKNIKWNDIKEFILDDQLFQWAKYGYLKDAEFDLKLYKKKHPERAKEIDFAILLIQSLNVTEGESTSMEHKLKSYKKMMDRYQQSLDKKPQIRVQNKRRQKILYAVCIAAFLCICFISHILTKQNLESKQLVLTTSMVNSKNTSDKIRIYLDDNKVLEVDKNDSEIEVNTNGSISVNDKIISKGTKKNTKINKIIVPYGKRSKVILPDSTFVWINSGTTISYPSNFQKNRTLKVQGEVYLEVRKKVEQPFIVKTKNLEVKVLGTTFNISDYLDDNLPSVVLVDGSIDIQMQNHSKRLTPSQRLSIKNNKIQIDDVDVYTYICWIDDIINFDGDTLSQITKSLARYYNVDIRLNDDIADIVFYGSLDLSESLKKVLEYISHSQPLKIEQEGSSIFISSQ